MGSFSGKTATTAQIRKSVERMDRALNSGKYFKKKDIRQKHPYGMNSSNSVTTATPNLRGSVESQSIRNARTRYNRTAKSTKETGAFSEANLNMSSEYSFYDRGFKEYDYHPLKKTKIRPMTAGVRREGKIKQKKCYRSKTRQKQVIKEEKRLNELMGMFSEWNKKEEEVTKSKKEEIEKKEEAEKEETESNYSDDINNDDFLGFKTEEITPNMTLEDFIKIGERIKMREELSKDPTAAPAITNITDLNENDAEFIKDEFQKDVLERDWVKLYDILNHLKSLSHSLFVNEIKI